MNTRRTLFLLFHKIKRGIRNTKSAIKWARYHAQLDCTVIIQIINIYYKLLDSDQVYKSYQQLKIRIRTRLVQDEPDYQLLFFHGSRFMTYGNCLHVFKAVFLFLSRHIFFPCHKHDWMKQWRIFHMFLSGYVKYLTYSKCCSWGSLIVFPTTV